MKRLHKNKAFMLICKCGKPVISAWLVVVSHPKWMSNFKISFSSARNRFYLLWCFLRRWWCFVVSEILDVLLSNRGFVFGFSSVSDADGSEGGFQLKKEHALRVLGYISSWTQRWAPRPRALDVSEGVYVIRLQKSKVHGFASLEPVCCKCVNSSNNHLQLFPAPIHQITKLKLLSDLNSFLLPAAS